MEQLAAICKKFGAEMIENASLKEYVTFKIGGKCDVLVKANCVDCVVETVRFCRENHVKFYLLGKGSNVLISDFGLHGVVILLGNDFSEINVTDTFISCNAGASLSKVCRAALENGLTGMEFAYGIPGTVGGALYMNAGAYGGEMADIAVCCTYLDENLQVCKCGADEMQLGYRSSIFEKKNYVILDVTFGLQPGNIDEIENKMNMLIEKRRTMQPLEFPSAGSTFKRPEGDFAARLIDASGLKGLSSGGAQVSEKHAGFVVNKGNASFGDVMNVIDIVKKKVYADTGIMLDCEIRILE